MSVTSRSVWQPQLMPETTSCARGDSTICPPPQASLTIISCKYENCQRLQFTTEFAKRKTTTARQNKHCATLPSLFRHCQSKAQHSRIWAQAMPFCPSNKLKVVSESRVTWSTSVPILVFLDLSVLDLGPMYATDRRQTASSLYAPAYYITLQIFKVA